MPSLHGHKRAGRGRETKKLLPIVFMLRDDVRQCGLACYDVMCLQLHTRHSRLGWHRTPRTIIDRAHRHAMPCRNEEGEERMKARLTGFEQAEQQQQKQRQRRQQQQQEQGCFDRGKKYFSHGSKNANSLLALCSLYGPCSACGERERTRRKGSERRRERQHETQPAVACACCVLIGINNSCCFCRRARDRDFVTGRR